MDSENENGGYGLVYRSVMRNNSLSIEAKAIYAYLSCYAGNKNECYPNVDLIVSELNISTARFYKHLNKLTEAGVISKHQKKNKNRWTNAVYRINHFYGNENADFEYTGFEHTQNEHTEIEHTQNRTANNNSINNIKNLYSSDEEYNQKGKPFCSDGETVKNEFGDAETARSNTLTKEINVKRQRYNAEQLKIIDNFFDLLKYTRRAGKIADSVRLKIYESWEKYEVQRIIYGLNVYIDNPNLHDKKESYVLGIIRNSTAEEISRKSGKTGISAKANKFIDYEQRNWDFNTLDKLKGELLDRSKDNKERRTEDIEDNDMLKRIISKSGAAAEENI